MSFVSDERGSATVEMVIWLPFLTALILFVLELTMFMFQSNQAHDLSRNVTRQVAIGLWTEEEAETELLERLNSRLNPQVDILKDENNLVRLSLSMDPLISVTGVFSLMNLSRIQVDYFMRSETAESEEEVS